MGNAFRGTRAGARVLGVSFNQILLTALAVAAIGVPPALAAESTAGSSALEQEFKLPPTFAAAQTQQLSTLFTSCINIGGMVNALGNMAQGMNPGAVTIDSPCPALNAAVVDPASLTCEAFTGPDGYFNKELVSQFRAKDKAAIESLSCRKGKYEAVKGELKCLTDQADILSRQIASIQDSYMQQAQAIQQDMTQMKSAIVHRDAQLEDVTSKLGGNQKTGERGLLAIRQEISQLSAGMLSEIQAIDEQQKAAIQQRRSLTEQVQARTMALASDCFRSRKNPALHCEQNGPAVSAYEAILCRLNQESHVVVVNGERRIEQDNFVKGQAGGKTGDLKTLLELMLGDAPSSAKLPTNPQEFQQAAEQPASTILTAADIETVYRDRLDAYNVPGLNVGELVTKEMGKCFTRASDKVEVEKAKATSQIGSQEFAIKKLERDTATKSNDLMKKYSRSYTTAMQGLTGMNLPVNTASCEGGKPSVQLSCLQSLHQNMEGLLKGTTSNSGITMVIKGTNAKNNVVFTCQGLEGCTTSLQNISRNIELEKKKLVEYKRNYVQQANLQFQRQTKQLASTLSTQSQALSGRLKALNSALAGMGIRGGIDIKSVEPEQMEQDEDGLVKPPKNVLKLVGSQMNPPMLDVSGNNFSGVLGGVGEGIVALDKQIAQVNAVEAKLGMVVTSCAMKPVIARALTLKTAVEQLGSEACARSQWCQPDKMTGLISAIQKAYDSPGMDPADATVLTSSIGGACSNGVLDPGAELAKCNSFKEGDPARGTCMLGAQDEIRRSAQSAIKCNAVFNGIQSKAASLGRAAEGAAKAGQAN